MNVLAKSLMFNKYLRTFEYLFFTVDMSKLISTFLYTFLEIFTINSVIFS